MQKAKTEWPDQEWTQFFSVKDQEKSSACFKDEEIAQLKLQLAKQAKEIAKKDNELARHHKQSLKALVSKGMQLDASGLLWH